MATISINPDADGDLHSAALHNDKFQSILNEINGNLDADNLANPDSFLTFTSFAGNSYHPTGPIYPWVGWTPTQTATDRATQATLAAQFIPTGVVDGCNIMVQSQFQNVTGTVMTLVSSSISYQTNPAYGNANLIVRLQQNASVGNGWTDMGTMTFNPNAAASNASNSTLTLAVPGLLSTNFFRVLVQNDSAVALGASPIALNQVCFTATFKVPHTD